MGTLERTADSRKASGSLFYDRILVLTFFLLAVFLCTFRISSDDDLFWHLATGKYIVENMTVPSADVFGFVTSGTHWVPFEWLWDAFNHLLYLGFGFHGILAMKTLLVAGMFFLLYKAARMSGSGNFITILVLSVLLFGMFERLLAKPYNVSYLFYAVVIYFILRHKSTGRLKYLYCLPPLFLLWANVHMGVLAGIAMLLIFLLSEAAVSVSGKRWFADEAVDRSRKNMKAYLLTAAASAAVIFINPHGAGTYVYTYSHMKMEMLRDIGEWYSPFGDFYAGSLYFCVYLFFLAGTLPVIYYSVRRKDLFAGILILAFGVYSAFAIRYTVDFIIVISVFLVRPLELMLMKIKGVRLYLPRNELKFALFLVLVSLAIMVPNNTLYRIMSYPRLFGYGVDGYHYPVKLFDFMEANSIHVKGDRPFNSFECGGYFIWRFPGKKNFIDSRNLSDEHYRLFDTIDTKKPGFEDKIKEIGFDYFIWFYPELLMETRSMQASVVSYLAENEDKWKLVYWDDRSFLFLRNEPKFAELIEKFSYKYLNPYNFIFRRNLISDGLKSDPETVKNEMNRLAAGQPEGTFAKYLLEYLRQKEAGK